MPDPTLLENAEIRRCSNSAQRQPLDFAAFLSTCHKRGADQATGRNLLKKRLLRGQFKRFASAWVNFPHPMRQLGQNGIKQTSLSFGQ
jgi:hypothetical protein